MTLRQFTILFLPLLLIAEAPAAPAPRPADPAVLALEKRVAELESALEESRADASFTDRGVRSFLDTRLNLGGFMESALTGIFQENRSPQAASSNTVLGINLGAVFSERLRFSSQLISGISLPIANPHDDSRASAVGVQAQRGFGAYNVTTLVTQAYGEWEGSDGFRVQGGVGYVPYGVTFQQLELVLFVRRGGPQLLRSNNELVHPLWQGLHVRGSFAGPSFRWGYNAYTFSPVANTQKLGVGNRLWLELNRGQLLLGLSHQTASRGTHTYSTVGPDIRARLGRLTVTGEFAKGYGTGPQPWSFHLEPDVDVYGQSILLYVFGDYLESKMNKTGALADPYKKWEYGAGVNWLPTSFTRIRLGYAYNDYVGSYAANAGGRDYHAFDASAGVAF